MKQFALSALAGWLAVVCLATAGDETNPLPDKCGYYLLNPTPAKLMRELSPDRPDKTESPYTVDAGHFQVEMDFANYTQNDSAGIHTRAWNVAPVNIKLGLLNNVDLQFIYDNYQHVHTEDQLTHTTATQSGFGDLTTRLKINLAGNDGGQMAFGLLPFVKLPTNTDHLGNTAVEGGLILPLGIKLPADWDMGLETGASFLRNDARRGNHAEVVNSVTFGHVIVGKLGGYCEFFSAVTTEGNAGWMGTVDVGLEYSLSENVQLDCGVNVGVTRTADDLNLFSGLTARF